MNRNLIQRFTDCGFRRWVAGHSAAFGGASVLAGRPRRAEAKRRRLARSLAPPNCATAGQWIRRGMAALAVGCCFAVGARPGGLTNEMARVWPAPPEPARVVYLQSIRSPVDAGARLPALKRAANWVTGANDGNEKLAKPFGIALDDQGNLCLTDTGANLVCYYDQAKHRWHSWNRIGGLRFASPVAVAKKGDTLFVADSALAAVVAFHTDGKLLFRIDRSPGRPAGVAVLGERLFVADVLRHEIAVFDLQGNPVSRFGRRGTGPGEFNFPTHVSADGAGHLLVTDSMNSRVQVFDAAGRFQGQIGGPGDGPGYFGRPKGAAVDTFGHVYVVDALFDNIQIFSLDGHLLLKLGEAGQTAGSFWMPNGIAIGRDNRIFVADSYNHRVQVFKYIGRP